MNRLLFNEGGQPIFLDDIKLLQDNDASFNRQFLNAVTGDSPIFLIKRLELKPVSVDPSKLTTTAKIFANSVVLSGGDNRPSRIDGNGSDLERPDIRLCRRDKKMKGENSKTGRKGHAGCQGRHT